jgi:hypothetical protein
LDQSSTVRRLPARISRYDQGAGHAQTVAGGVDAVFTRGLRTADPRGRGQMNDEDGPCYTVQLAG